MAANPLGEIRTKLRASLITWTVIWIVAVIVLLAFWQHLPMWVSWPLAMLEAILVPDHRVLKGYFFKSEGAKESHEV